MPRAVRAALLLLLTAAPRAGAAGGAPLLVQSDAATDRLAEKGAVALAPRPTGGAGVVVHDGAAPLQSVVGFGGAFTQSAAVVFANATPAVRQQLLELTYGATGHGYVLGRVPMGSSDFSTYHYSYDDVDGDTALANFSVAPDRAEVIPLLRAAQSLVTSRRESLKLVSSPWSAPAWMKKNGNYRCPLDPFCTGCTLKPEYLDTWAEYFVRYLDAYAAEGLAVWAVTPQNEPGACQNNYEAMHWTADTERDFIKQHLGPAMRRAHPGTLLLAYDHNKDHIQKWADAILGDAEAANYTDGIAFHWYSEPGGEFEKVAAVRAKYPGTLLLATEATEGGDKGFATEPNWGFGEEYARDIIGDLRAGASGWVDWNLWLEVGAQKDGFHFGPSHYNPVPDEGGNNAMLVVDNEAGKVYPQAMYWAMGHVSRYVRPGAEVLSAECPPRLLCTAARNPDGSVAVVVLNDQDDAAEYSAALGGRGQETVSLPLPAHSIHTLVWPPPAA